MRKIIFGLMMSMGLVYGDLPEPLFRLLEVMEVPHDGSLPSIVAATQERWIRPAGKERWQTADLPEEAREKVITLAEEMGFFHEIRPALKEYDYAVILGATVFRMQKRFETLIRLWDQGVRFRQIVILTGARPLDPAVEALAELCKTEGEAAEVLWKLAPVPEEMPEAVFIEVPMIRVEGGFRRPNTSDTAKAWLETKPQSGTCLFISNQPYCFYQDAVMKTLLPVEYAIETVGDGAEAHRQNAAVVLDTIARWLYQLQLSEAANG